jgi:predicted dienelactone hydrolase
VAHQPQAFLLLERQRFPRFGAIADAGRLALVGHSLGGYTVLGLAGAWPSWRLPGVRAIVALSPYSLPFESSEGMRHIGVPVMFQVGALDPVFTVPLRMFGYEQTPAPKYLVQFALATHLAWTDAGFTDREEIVDYAVTFLDHYVKDVAALPVRHDGSTGVASFTAN